MSQLIEMKSRAITVYQQKKTEVRQGKFEPEDIKRKHPNITVADIVDAYLEARGEVAQMRFGSTFFARGGGKRISKAVRRSKTLVIGW